MSVEGNGKPEKPKFDDNIGIATEVAKRCVTLRRGESLLDTFEYADALLGLMKACDTFDPEKKTKEGKPITFGTYAWKVIRSEISYGRKTRDRQNRLSPVLLGEMQGQDRQGVFEIPDDSEPPLPLHLLDKFFADNSRDTPSQVHYKKIVYDYYINDMTLEELGDKHGVTKQRIHQLLKRGEQLIRDQFAEEIEAAKDD